MAKSVDINYLSNPLMSFLFSFFMYVNSGLKVKLSLLLVFTPGCKLIDHFFSVA